MVVYCKDITNKTVFVKREYEIKRTDTFHNMLSNLRSPLVYLSFTAYSRTTEK